MEEEAILVRFNDFPVAVEETITKEDAANRVRTSHDTACSLRTSLALCLKRTLTNVSGLFATFAAGASQHNLHRTEQAARAEISLNRPGRELIVRALL